MAFLPNGLNCTENGDKQSEVLQERVEKIIKRFVLDWDQMADYVEEGCGANVKHAMQKVLRVAMQVEDFFYTARPRGVLKDLAQCFIKHSARALAGEE